MKDFGKALDSAVIEQGLRELNPDIHFDMGAKINQWHPYIEYRQGVFYHGKHICSMDRGHVPEYKVWSVVERITPCSLADGDMDGAVVRYIEVLPNHPGYRGLYEDARLGRLDDYTVRPDGKLIRISAHRVQKIRGQCVSVGWRHTFERLLQAKIPGITRTSLAGKFGVDMLKFPVGTPEEMVDALMGE